MTILLKTLDYCNVQMTTAKGVSLTAIAEKKAPDPRRDPARILEWINQGAFVPVNR